MARVHNACFVVLVLAVGAFAGCLDGGAQAAAGKAGGKKVVASPPKQWHIEDPVLSQKIFDEVLFEALPLRASDGARLDNWMYRPKAPDGVKVPAIVHLSPYYGSSLPNGGGNMLRILNQNFTERGYVVIGASVRGTGFSEGCFEIGGPRERQDYVELFNHIAEQPWSNGLIGLIGVSYDGTAPQGALITGSPHLKTIVPIAAISEWYKYNFIKGVQINPQGWAFNTYYVALEQAPVNVRDPLDPMQDVEDIRTYTSRACLSQGGSNPNTRGPSVVDVQRAQIVTAPTGATDPYWEDRNFTRFLDKVQENVSVFVVHGLLDYNVKTHNLLPWYTELQAKGIPTKIQLGQWAHAYPGTVRPSGRADWNLTLLRWFDYWLKGIDTGIMDEPSADIQDFSGVWRTEAEWPPKRAVPTTLYFDASGSLKTQPGAGESRFVDNGASFNPVLPASPHAAAFLGPALDEPFRYSGEAYANLQLTHTAARGQVAVTVYSVSGTVWRPVNWGFFNYNIRNGPDLDKYAAVVPGQAFSIQVPLLPTDMVIEKGSRIGIVLSGQSTGGPGMLPLPSGGVTTIMHGARSSITFPTLYEIAPMCPQPKMLGRDGVAVC